MGLGIALGAYTNEYNNQRNMRKDDEIHALKKEEFGWKRDEVEQEKTYKSKVAELANQSPLKGYQAELAQWEDAGGQGPQPQPPNAFQMLQFNSQLADIGLQFGKHDPRIAVENAKFYDHLKKEGYLTGIQKLRAGDLEGASQAFNSSGNERVDMSQAVPVQVPHRGPDGQTRNVTAYQLPDGTVINPEQVLESMIPIEKLLQLNMDGRKTDAYVANQSRPRATGGGREPSRKDQILEAFYSTENPEELEMLADLFYAETGKDLRGKTDSEGVSTPGPLDRRRDALNAGRLMAPPTEEQIAAMTPKPEAAPAAAPGATAAEAPPSKVEEIRKRDPLESMSIFQLRAFVSGRGPSRDPEMVERAKAFLKQKEEKKESDYYFMNENPYR